MNNWMKITRKKFRKLQENSYIMLDLQIPQCWLPYLEITLIAAVECFRRKNSTTTTIFPLFQYFHHKILPVLLHMPCLTSSNGCQFYPAEYSWWYNLILLLQISCKISYPYPWHRPYQHCTNMHKKISFHWMCAPEYAQLVLPATLRDMQIFVLPTLHSAHTLPWTSFSV